MTKATTSIAHSVPINHPDELAAAPHLIRHYIVQPDREEDIHECAKRAKHVLKEVRDYAAMVGRQMLMDFNIGPVACIIERPACARSPATKVAYFGAHTLENGDIGKVIPLYK